ncbi:MAG: MBL fold metallo-hydrolase [Candidatus Eisenbacteria bacterium]|uniref:MBL fold metallo-hydrolase n=1 Tax=Eiseniibacteriota bacterium TaxID=2212470 RepID=A0A849SP08_UNCEI|nr:MBL fold metallo-hydrolase [Candidatus Eisenbacteria bacterium]
MASLELGPWRAHTLETGTLRLDGGSMFGSVPKPLWSRAHPADERNRIQLSMRCLLLEGHGRRVLVDTGLGDKFSPKLAEIYAVENESGTLERSLAALSLGVEDITDVILTHLHFDHAGGATRAAGGTVVPRLPRALYYAQRRNLENARHPNPRERASYMEENFEPLERAGVLRLWDGPGEPWPGLELFTADGHTRGQQLVRVHGGGVTLYFVADLIPTRSHVRVPFVMGYDVAAIETMQEKRDVLERASRERAWICLEHDPEFALARPEAQADDFGWAEHVAAIPLTASTGS